MAYPATTKTLQKWVQDVDQLAAGLRTAAQQQKAFSSAGSLNMDMVRRFFDQLVQGNVFFTAAAGVSGIGAYLNSEKQNMVADPVAEFQAMQAAIVSTLDWLRANVPQGAFSGQNYKLAFLFPPDNVTASSPLTFTAQQTATYRTVLDSLIATIG